MSNQPPLVPLKLNQKSSSMSPLHCQQISHVQEGFTSVQQFFRYVLEQ